MTATQERASDFGEEWACGPNLSTKLNCPPRPSIYLWSVSDHDRSTVLELGENSQLPMGREKTAEYPVRSSCYYAYRFILYAKQLRSRRNWRKQGRASLNIEQSSGVSCFPRG